VVRRGGDVVRHRVGHNRAVGKVAHAEFTLAAEGYIATGGRNVTAGCNMVTDRCDSVIT
jgi:hypothetical protein